MATHHPNQSPVNLSELTERPQPLGLLPSMRFWNQRKNWRLIALPVTAATVAGVGLAWAIDLPMSAAGWVGTLVPYLTIGLLERGIRRRAGAHFERSSK